MIMASFKTTFVATFLLYFSYSFLIGCAQQYEYDYSAEARLSNWQSSRTSRTRNADAPSRFDVKNSSPDLAGRNRPRTQSRYEGDGIVRPQYETTRQNAEEQPERTQQMRGRQRSRQRVPDAGRAVERRVDEVTQPTPVASRRRPNRVRVTESTTQASEQFTPRLRVPMEDTVVNQPRGFSSARDNTGRSRQRVRVETVTVETSTASSPRPFSRGRVKAKIYDTPRRSSSSVSKTEEISESDNYPAAFIEKIKSSESHQLQQEDATPRRSRLRQRAAKTYPAIALSEANRFRQRYTRPTTSTEKLQTTTDVTSTDETPTRRSNLFEARQRSRSRYTTPKITTDFSPKPFRSYSRRFTTTEKNENSDTGYTTTVSPRQKYLSRLRTTNRQFKSPKVIPDKVVEEEKKKEESLESAENSFYMHLDDLTTEGSTQKMTNMDVDLETDASEEDEMVETEKTTERTTTTSSTTITEATTITTTAATTETAATTATSAKAGASLPVTRHRFSSRFSRSNKTTTPDDVTRPTPESDSLVLDIVTPAPINLTSLFDDSPDSTLSITALFNNSFNASSSVATNKTNSPETLTSSTTTTSTARPSTVTENSSTSSSTTTTKRTTKKKSQKKSRKSSKSTTTPASALDALNDRPILRNIVSLFGNAEPTTKRSSGKRKSSRTGTTTARTTTTSTTTPGPQEIAQIQNIINETMGVIRNHSGGPAAARLVPRLALNALTPETSVEETTTQPSATATTVTSSSTTTTTTTSAPTTTTTVETTIKTANASTTTTTARTTSSTTVTTSTTSTSTARSGALSNGTRKKNCTSQFVYFDYNSSEPIPQQYFNSQKTRPKTTSTTPASTTADYFVYGVYPNNTIVRKRAWKTFDYEKYHSPYVIFGIYPNNTIVKKFPNGTIINDEFMTSDNEIRDIMGLPRKPTSTTTTKRPETTTTTTTKKPETTTTTAKPKTTTAKPATTTIAEMRMAGSVTTENVVEEVTTEEESPDSMFEIIENEIEREERKDEELESGTTESATSTVSDENSLQFEGHFPSTTTEANVATTEQPSVSAENVEATTASASTTEATTRVVNTETTPRVNTMETTESLVTTTLKSMREGKSFSFNDIFSEDIVDSTTEKLSTTTVGSISKETTESDLFDRLSDEVETDVSSTTERTGSTTDSTDRTTESNFDLQNIFKLTTTRYDSSGLFDIDRSLGDGPVYRPSTTEASAEEGSTVQSLFDLEGSRFLSTTEVPTTSKSISELSENRLVESTTAETPTTSKSLFDLFETDFFGSTTPGGPTTTRSIPGASDSNFIESTTTEVPTTSKSLFGLSEANLFGSTMTVAPTTSNSLFGLPESDLFGSTTTETTTTSRPVFRSSGSTPAESTTTEVPTTFKSLFGLSENSLFGSTTTDTPTTTTPVFRQPNSNLVESTTTEIPTTFKSLFGLSENNVRGYTTDSPTTTRPVFKSSGSTPTESTTTEVSTTLTSLFGLSENSVFGFTTDTPSTIRPVFRQSGSRLIESTTTESPTTSRSLFGLSESDLFGSTTEPATTTKSIARSTESRLVEQTTTEIPTTLRSLFGLSEANLFGSTTTETPNSSESATFTSAATERRNSEEFTTVSNDQNEIALLSAGLFQLPDGESSVTKSTMREDEPPGLVNLAYRALGSGNTITTVPTPTTTKTLNYITSTMKSTNFKEKKVRMKMKRTSTSTPKTENVFVVTPETTISETDYGKKGKVKFVTLTPGVIVTTDVRDENDVITMSSQHVQKVTKAPANIPDNFLTSVVGEIQKSSSPIPDILKNVEKELQGNGISVSLARRIIEMAIERAVTTEVSQTTGQIRETTLTTPYVTTTRRIPTTTAVYTTPTPTPYRTESTTSNEVSTAYNDLYNTVNLNPLSVGVVGDSAESTTKKVNEDDINRLVQGLWKDQTQTTTIRTTTTTKSSKRTKSSRNPAASTTTLSQNDKLLLEAILKQQNSNLSVQELDKIIENQIRLAEEVRKASKNMKKKPRVTTTTTTTTTQTPPLFGFLISLFSGNSSPSNIPVTRSPIKQTRSRLKSSRGPGSMKNNPNKPDPLKEAEVGNPSGERSSRGELVTAAIDVTKAVSKFMGTFLSSAAQSFQAFFSNFGRGR